VRVAACLLHAHDLVEDLCVAAREEGAAVDDHVDLVRAELDDGPRLRDLDLGRRLARGEGGGHGRDLHTATREAFLRDTDETRIDADRGHRGDGKVDGIGAHRLRAERRDLARRVLPLEGGEIHHAHRELERLYLRLALDRALRERRRAFLERDRVDRTDPRQPRAGGQLEAADQCWSLCHVLSVERRRCHPDTSTVQSTSSVELRVSRSQLLLAAVIGLAAIAAGLWLDDLVGWLAVVSGAACVAAASYRLVRKRPRLTLSTTRIAWSRHSLPWSEIASMRELRFRFGLLRPNRLHVLAISTTERRQHHGPDRLLGADYTINISGLEQPAGAVLDLVEQFSGQTVERLP
jgi:hypothetical protein